MASLSVAVSADERSAKLAKHFPIDMDRVHAVDLYVTGDAPAPVRYTILELSRDDTEHFLLYFEKCASAADVLSAFGNWANWDAWVDVNHAEFVVHCNDLLFK